MPANPTRFSPRHHRGTHILGPMVKKTDAEYFWDLLQGNKLTDVVRMSRQVVEAAREVVTQPGADLRSAPLGPLKQALDAYDRIITQEIGGGWTT